GGTRAPLRADHHRERTESSEQQQQDPPPSGAAAPPHRRTDGAPVSPRVLVAGGGTAGHVVPALTVADAITELEPGAQIVCLGTAGGLENTLVPQHGYRLELIPQVKFTRKLNADTL